MSRLKKLEFCDEATRKAAAIAFDAGVVPAADLLFDDCVLAYNSEKDASRVAAEMMKRRPDLLISTYGSKVSQ